MFGPEDFVDQGAEAGEGENQINDAFMSSGNRPHYTSKGRLLADWKFRII
jgi:hypothetical protein